MIALAQDLVTIESVQRSLPDKPIAATRDRGWPGVTVDVHARSPDYFVRTAARDHHLVCLCLSGRGRLIQRRAGATRDSVVSAGMSIVAPAEYEAVWEGEASSSARVRVPVVLTQDASHQIVGRDQTEFELSNVFQTNDLDIERLTTLFLSEIARAAHPAQALIVDALSCALRLTCYGITTARSSQRL